MAPLLAFVDIFVESAHMDDVVQALAKLDNIEELYEVTGEFDIVTLVTADDIEEFRDVLKNRVPFHARVYFSKACSRGIGPSFR